MNDMYQEFMPQKNNNQSATQSDIIAQKAKTVMMKILQMQNEGYGRAA